MCQPSWKTSHFSVNYTFDDIKLERFRRFKYIGAYLLMYFLIFKSIVILMTDIFLAIFIGISAFNSDFFQSFSKANASFNVQTYVQVLYAPIYIICVIISLVLLTFDTIRAYRIVNSSHIAKSFTSKMAQRYFSIKGYEYFCFYQHIMRSRSFSDKTAFFVYTHFSNWKRVLLADGPRRILNFVALYILYRQGMIAYMFSNFKSQWAAPQSLAILSMMLVCLSWVMNMFFLIVSYILLIPLFFCVIQGSVRKYVEVKIEKRLTNEISDKDLMKHNDSRLLQPRLPDIEDPFDYTPEKKRNSVPSFSSGSISKYQPSYHKLPPRIDTNAYLYPGPQQQPQYMPVSPAHSERPQYYLPSPTESSFDGQSQYSSPERSRPLYYEPQTQYSPYPEPPMTKNASFRSNKEKRTLSAKNSIKRFSDASSNITSPTPFSHFQ